MGAHIPDDAARISKREEAQDLPLDVARASAILQGFQVLLEFGIVGRAFSWTKLNARLNIPKKDATPNWDKLRFRKHHFAESDSRAQTYTRWIM